jgi:hypothetical protein
MLQRITLVVLALGAVACSPLPAPPRRGFVERELRAENAELQAEIVRLREEVRLLNVIINGEPSGVTYDGVTTRLAESNAKLQEVLVTEWVATGQ